MEKYTNSTDDNSDVKAVIMPRADSEIPFHASYISTCTMTGQIKELEQQGSSGAMEMERERLKLDYKRSTQMLQQWKKMYENSNQFCVNELLDGDHSRGPAA
ncbi:hypothetical protein AG4045_009393 [Apium graveolens]|uniref:Uncharacterized protein n=1 Tax=Apium graveolens TaxID=4045 RepID=A0A6L5BAF4_APIGR|nr:hypothetical protein AG4045_009393 [Apium graveolens]